MSTSFVLLCAFSFQSMGNSIAISSAHLELGTESGDDEKIDCVLSRRDSYSAVSLLCVIDRVSIFRIKSSSQLDVVSFSTIVFADSQSHCSKCHFLSFLQAPVETYLLSFFCINHHLLGHGKHFLSLCSLVNCV